MKYLIITRIKEFWPKDASPSIMMGPWCFSDLDNDKSHNYPMLECPWPNYGSLQHAYSTAQEAYKTLLPIIARVLNKIHSTSYQDRYWQIIIGPWLQKFVHVTHDRISRLRVALDRYPLSTVIGIDSSEFIVPVDTVDFAYLIRDDIYNIQIITAIAQNIGLNVKALSNVHLADKSTDAKPTFSERPASILKIILKRVYNYFRNLCSSNAEVILYNSYHPKRLLYKIFILSLGKIIEQPSSKIKIISAKKSVEQRFRLREYLYEEKLGFKQASLQETVLSILDKELPLAFLECYAKIELQAMNNFKNLSPKVIYSANAWYYDEPFKFWSAAAACNGVVLIGLQHGGNYGVLSLLPDEEHEKDITDRYLTWGWLEDRLNRNVISTPAQKLYAIKHHSLKSNELSGILFVNTIAARYQVEFPAIPEHMLKYIEWQQRFIKSTTAATRAVMRVRLYQNDFGWDMRKRLTYIDPSLHFEDWSITFLESLSTCRLYVCDHLSTTYIEALASNTPTVLFWDTSIIKLRPQAQKYFNDLRKVGILHDTPESAASWIEKVYSDIDSWWKQKECQQAVENFCKNYARASEFPAIDWLRILKKKDINSKGKMYAI